MLRISDKSTVVYRVMSRWWLHFYFWPDSHYTIKDLKFELFNIRSDASKFGFGILVRLNWCIRILKDSQFEFKFGISVRLIGLVCRKQSLVRLRASLSQTISCSTPKWFKVRSRAFARGCTETTLLEAEVYSPAKDLETLFRGSVARSAPYAAVVREV